MDIIAKRKLWFIISGVLLVIGIVAILTQGLNLGIDFTGGTIMQFSFDEQVPNSEIREILSDSGITKDSVVQQTENNGVQFKTAKLSQDQVVNIQNKIEEKYPSAEMLRTAAVGPTIGQELKANAIKALIIAAIAIVIYISVRFEFRFAMAAILALLHDVFIVLGAFAILGREINSPFVAALLTIVGYSINDTIVIFDRIREKMHYSKRDTFEGLTNQALLDTLPRSINTSATTLLPILAILFLGGTTIQTFMVALLIGMLSGTYSSIFVASPILVEWNERKEIKI
ncbi:protein translocase subunit SecF [Halanaerobacter jeridensis]|uniref:Protein-export membrane protein SecF n=1 Tax=Halanaerobacter jeridensis TaxID=706427 RepID=A0A938XVC6_9FIRM|nr:preprotein translocase subunit SecF [Halanaerobacter jeridensis]